MYFWSPCGARTLHFWSPFCKVQFFMRFSAAVERSGTEAENLGGSLLVGCFLAPHRLLQAVALAGEYHNVRVMHQTVYQSRL